MPTALTANFTLEELTFSQTAARLGIVNSPDAQQIDALKNLCVNVLQPLRDALGETITVSSGFRCPALNRAVSGASDSQHLLGQAADLQCFTLAPAEFFRRTVAQNLPFDQLIFEGGPRRSVGPRLIQLSRLPRTNPTATFPEPVESPTPH